MVHIWTIVCKNVLINPSENNISLIDVIENVTIHGTNKKELEKSSYQVPLDFAVVTKINLEENDPPLVMLKTVIIDPQEVEVASSEKLIETSKNKKVIKNIMKFKTFIGNGFGEHRIQIQVKGEKDKEFRILYELPIDVDFQEKKDIN